MQREERIEKQRGKFSIINLAFAMLSALAFLSAALYDAAQTFQLVQAIDQERSERKRKRVSKKSLSLHIISTTPSGFMNTVLLTSDKDFVFQHMHACIDIRAETNCIDFIFMRKFVKKHEGKMIKDVKSI